MSEIDLLRFCNPEREVAEPFSAGAFTYACNGHVMVRVARRAEVPERWVPWEVQELWEDAEASWPESWARIEGLPQILTTWWVQIADVTVKALYLRDLMTLPGLLVEYPLHEAGVPRSKHGCPLVRFRFDGGEALLAPAWLSERDAVGALMLSLVPV
ncbi:MAG: hypothetical protein KGH75_00840 [Rhodospirillales bacterium]|nr:hypothetical protein [Rhodospirillales bacterium]